MTPTIVGEDEAVAGATARSIVWRTCDLSPRIHAPDDRRCGIAGAVLVMRVVLEALDADAG